MKVFVSAVVMLLVLCFGVAVVAEVKATEAKGPFYIRSTGEVDPPTPMIQRNGDIYTLTGNITSDTDAIVIEKDNLTLNGAGYTLQGNGTWRMGIDLVSRRNVTIESFNIIGFSFGIRFSSSSNNTVTNNTLANSYYGVVIDGDSSFNYILENTIRNNTGDDVVINHSSNNTIIGNIITQSEFGVHLLYSATNNTIVMNNITKNQYGLFYSHSGNNSIYHNNFVENVNQAAGNLANEWDKGYPSSGNYWSDHPNADPYVIDENNTDHYPLSSPYPIPEVSSFLILPLFMIATLLATIVLRKKRVCQRSLWCCAIGDLKTAREAFRY